MQSPRPLLLDQPAFWCTIVGLVLLIGGFGLGVRVTVAWLVQSAPNRTEVNAQLAGDAAAGDALDAVQEAVGRIAEVDVTSISILTTDGKGLSLTISGSTEVFSLGTSTPVRPDEQPEKLTMQVNDLASGDLVVVKYQSLEAEARSIQLIR